MRHGLVVGVLAAAVLALAVPARAQAPAADPEVEKGIRQVEEGDYDAAILTLDAAARRLGADAGHSRELSQAYLYLGVAYIGKGHEAAAKAKFKEAVKQLRDLTLSPDKFPPKVIDVFEAARDEVSREPGPTAAAPARSASTTPPAMKKGGGKKFLLFGGLSAAAAGGVLIATKGHGESACDSVYVNRSGPLSLPNDSAVEVLGGPAIEDGLWFAELTWSGGAPDSDVILSAYKADGTPLLDGGLVHPGGRKAEWNGQAGVMYGARARLVKGGPVSFELSITGPCIN